MIIPAVPANELIRLAALHQCKILDTPPEATFDEITQLAANCCHVPIALVSLIDTNRQWFKSKIGLQASETPREYSFCGHAILQPDVFIVSDAWVDERFADNPLVTGEPFVRAYAGVPLITSQGCALGTLCVIDRVPRQFSADQIENLKLLARQVVRLIELRQNLIALERTAIASKPLQNRSNVLLGKVAIGFGLILTVLVGLSALSLTHALDNSALGNQTTYLAGIIISFCIACGTCYLMYQDEKNHYQVEESLEQERDFISAVLDTIGALVVVLDAEGRIVRFNRSCEQMTGYSFAEVWGQHFWDLFLIPDEISSVKMQFNHLKAGHFPNGHQNYWLTKLGESRLIDWSNTALVNSQGKVEYVIGTGIDITDRQKAEQAISQLATIVKSSDDAIVSMDLDGKIVSWNPGAEKIYGYLAEEAKGQKLTDLVTLDTPWQVAELTTRSDQFEINSKPFKTQHRRKDGHKIDVFMTLSLLKDADGNVLGSSMIANDISDLRAVERMKEEFVSIVSHELRTPLSSLRGSLGLLSSGKLGDLSDKGYRMLSIALKNTDRLVCLINDILDLERLESHRSLSSQEMCDMAGIVAQVREIMQPMLDNAGIMLSVSTVPTQLLGDRQSLIQLLTHLLNNAIKFSAPNTTVWLTTEVRSPDQPGLTRSRHASSSSLLIQVKDQGKGIPSNQLEAIFERFRQVDASNSRQVGGTGLGLTICRKIVEQHGGEIWAESLLGHGSTFCVSLPLA